MKICPVILCGGAGTRLWPLSRRKYPKQFMDLGGHTLFEDTLQRLAAVPGLAAPVVICNEEQRFLAAAALQRQGLNGRILLEPEPRNTAPAIAAAALAVTAACDVEDGDPVLLVLPSDHVLEDLPAFAAAVTQAAECAREGALVTFGVTPDRPETGYGYIEKGDALASGFAVRRFVEKPAQEAAEAMLAQGGYFWNSGMFVFRASQYLAELEAQAPAIMAAVRKAWALRRADYDFIRLHRESFAHCPSDSVDYALMEKSAHVAMVPLLCRWSDLGSWEAIYENSTQDAEGNACVGDVMAQDSRGCYIHAGSRLVTTLGVKDLVVVETGDAVLVADRARSQEVKTLVARLAAQDRHEQEMHLRVYRPWGWYETLALGERFQVKRIQVNPGAALSLQRHRHRAEHWVVIAGEGLVRVGDEEMHLHVDQSVYIPQKTMHRLSNASAQPLEIVEVQTGDYLGEDDIERFDDRYGRE
ncbi:MULTISPECIES: mannose-1-phosphate guanylyltransferase/mannose-6-phosphate isomerase [Desulfovibrio]|uniref:mannose-1-phosphate guanylyltransferase/mannose-6-phosphate isomerase n=1 Tax=Desulfovibrio TaxID=872 RepID=UPI002664F6E7|nr:mannose-1-phosphate guanylyltransferase/mannose-6-phosphate isomerase [Desulfovibrio piger]